MDSFIQILILLLIFTFLYYIIYDEDKRRIEKEINKLPGPRTFPFIGTTWEIVFIQPKGIFEFLLSRCALYRPIFRVWAGTIPKVIILKAEYIEVVLSNVEHLEKGIMYYYLRPWLGLSLLTSFGERWFKHKKLLTQAFHIKILENFFDVFAEKSSKLVYQLKEKSNGKPFDLYPLITHCTLDMVCETAMGVEINAMDAENSEYVAAIYSISENILKRDKYPWLHNDFIFNNFSTIGRNQKRCIKFLHEFSNKIIQERKLYIKQRNAQSQLCDEDLLLGKKKRMSFLDLLIKSSDDGKILTDEDIRQEVDTFLVAGHDTTTAGVSWNLFLLGNYPEIQDKVAEELQDIFGDEDRNINLEDLTKMKYLERVIKETLRLYPSVPAMTRRLGSDLEIGGYNIPRGCEVVMFLYDLHRDPEQFPNPEVFDPDNFLPEKCKKRHPYAYIPFSAGPRNCIGHRFAMMEMKIILSSIIRKYKIHAIDKRSEIKIASELILRPKDNLLVTLENRK